ncbi:hypothetical protein Bca4012_044748 [Brassica carinata]
MMMIMFISAKISQAQRTKTVAIHNDLEGDLSVGYYCKSGMMILDTRVWHQVDQDLFALNLISLASLDAQNESGEYRKWILQA